MVATSGTNTDLVFEIIAGNCGSLQTVHCSTFSNDTIKDRVIDQTILDFNLFSDNDSEIKLFSNIHQGHMNSAYKMFKSNIIFQKFIIR